MKYMKKLSLFILACICTLGSYADDVAVFNALVNRLLPDYSSQITGKKLPEGKNDYFQLSSVGDKIEIAGNNANSMAVGLNYYLKYYCNTNVSWFVVRIIRMTPMKKRLFVLSNTITTGTS